MFDWRDAIFDDATARALTLLRPVLDQSGISGVKLVSLLGTTLAGILLARAHRDKGVKGGALESAIFRSLLASRPFGLGEWKDEAAKWARWSERWPAARLSAGLRATLATDQALKNTTLSDEEALLGELVMRLGVSRAERVACLVLRGTRAPRAPVLKESSAPIAGSLPRIIGAGRSPQLDVLGRFVMCYPDPAVIFVLPNLPTVRDAAVDTMSSSAWPSGSAVQSVDPLARRASGSARASPSARRDSSSARSRPGHA